MSEMDHPTKITDRQKRIGLWSAGIFAAIIGTVFGTILYGVLINHQGQFDNDDAIFLPVTALLFGVSLLSFFLIWREKYKLGTEILFITNMVLPFFGILFLDNILWVSIAFIVGFGSILYKWVLQRSSRRFALILLGIVILLVISIEIWNPGFRGHSDFVGDYLWIIIVPIAAIFILGLVLQGFREAWRRTIRVKLLFVISLVLIVTVFFQTGVTLRAQRETNEAAEHQYLLSLYQDYNEEIETQTISSAALSDSFADREDIKLIYLADNREGLLVLLTPIFDTLKTQYNIRHLYVENPDGTVYVRIHNPEKFGDDVTYRLTAAAALESKETVSGVEIGPNRIGIRSVSPLWQEGDFTGMLEVGLDYDQDFLESFKARNNAEYNLWITHAAAAAPGLAPDETAPSAPTDQLFYYAGTNPLNLPNTKDDYDQVLATGEPITKFVSVEDQEWAVIIAPMLGYGNRVIGILEILTSRTETLTKINRDRFAVLIPASLLTLAGLAVLWVVINQVVLRPVGTLSSVAERQLKGDLSARVENFPPDEFGDLGRTFNNLSEQLQNTLQTQEQTIINRTKALETSTEVGRQLSTILDQRELVREVVEQVQSAFKYYHVHIYLFDNEKETLQMVGGTGNAGQTMLAQGHSVAKGSGLVGRTADTNLPILVSDVSQAEGWLSNPLLPDTKAEVAIPIAVGENVLGVLDVQDDQVGGLTDADVDLLQSIGNQVATALQNARSYQIAQHQADRETVMANINQQIQNTTDVEDALQVAVRELGRALKTDTSVKLHLPKA